MNGLGFTFLNDQTLVGMYTTPPVWKSGVDIGKEGSKEMSKFMLFGLIGILAFIAITR